MLAGWPLRVPSFQRKVQTMAPATAHTLSVPETEGSTATTNSELDGSSSDMFSDIGYRQRCDFPRRLALMRCHRREFLLAPLLTVQSRLDT